MCVIEAQFVEPILCVLTAPKAEILVLEAQFGGPNYRTPIFD